MLYEVITIEISHNRLKELGINVITNTKLQKCEDGFAYLAKGTKSYNSCLIFTGGVEANKITEELDVSLNPKGQIIVNEFMQSDKDDHIFAIGDAAEIRNQKGELMPPNVTIARISGTNAGKNVLNMIKNKKLIPCDPKLEGILIV